MPLTEAQLREAFELFDSDRSGHIDQDELFLAFKGLGYNCSREEVLEMVQKADKDGNMTIDFSEFCQLIEKQQGEAEGPAEVLKAFKAFDMSCTGEITRDDLRNVAKSLGEKVTEQDIEEIWKYCAENDMDDEGNCHFTFHAWRTVMQEMYDKNKSRGNAAMYDDGTLKAKKEQGLPGSEAAIWRELEEQEEKEREKRAAELEKKEQEKKEKERRAAEAKKNIEKYKAEAARLDAEMMERREKEIRRIKEEQALSREKREKMYRIQEEQKRAEEERKAREAAEEAAVREKIAQKRASSGTTPANNEAAVPQGEPPAEEKA